MFTEKQKKVFKCATHRWNILSGATRSGKTFVTFFLIPQRIESHYEENVLFVGKTLATLDRNILDPMRGIFGDNVSAIRGSSSGVRYVTVFGKKVYCIGANDDRAITKIQGMGLGYAYLDEVTTYPENFFAMLKSRLDKEDSICDATCNPEQPTHFVKKHIDNPDIDCYNEHFTIYDNTTLPPEFVKNLENEYRGTIYFDRWILGKWTKAEGLVYPLFRRERHYLTPKHFAEIAGNHRIVTMIYGVDGANANDATAIEPLAILDNGQAVVLEGFYHDPKANGQISNQQLAPLIWDYMTDMDEKYHLSESGTQFCTVIDCAAADLVLNLGYVLPENYNVQKFTKKDILATTDTVNNALGRNAIYILDFGGWKNYVKDYVWVPGERQLVTDLEAMTWDERNPRTYDASIPNDSADAFRYAVSAYYTNPYNLWETPDSSAFFPG